MTHSAFSEIGERFAAAVARRMAENLDASFVVRRPRVAFPDRGVQAGRNV